MNGAAAFSEDYRAARERFRVCADRAGFAVQSHPVGLDGPDGTALTVDVAVKGDAQPRHVVLVSSGLHGVEGFFGSAVQAALLDGGLDGWPLPSGVALVLIHALNPYGFAFVRRFDESNIDLNRNFLRDGETYSGSPPRYRELDWFLNPSYPPSRFDAFLPRAVWAIARHGFKELKQAVAEGQYEFPHGLFFGGFGPARIHRLLETLLPALVGPAEQVIHVDIHTGLGRWADYRLLVDPTMPTARRRWLAERFGTRHVEVTEPEGIAYRARGDLDMWCGSLFPGRPYTFVCAEFGTYAPLYVLRALRDENQAHHWGEADAPATRRAKYWLKEVFAPESVAWRQMAVRRGVHVVRRALESCRDRIPAAIHDTAAVSTESAC